jgi:hypothetical protein
MINVRTGVAALALVLAVAGAATPALARHRAHHPASEARAQALDPGDAMMTPDRERALHECSDASNRFIERDWGVQQDERMASCMMQHGQPM